MVTATTSPIRPQSGEQSVQCPSKVVPEDIWESVSHVLLYIMALPGPETFETEDDVVKIMLLECSQFGLEVRHIHAVAIVANEVGALSFAYRTTVTDADLWRRRIQGGARWVLSQMEKKERDMACLFENMTRRCKVLTLSDREMLVIISTLLQTFENVPELPRWLTRDIPNNLERTSSGVS